MNAKNTLCLLLFSLLFFNPEHTSGNSGSIRFSAHNLSNSGPGPVTAISEDRICIFCHPPAKPMRALPYQWNRRSKPINYLPYKSSTLKASVGQPTGASRVCLSCHDGTIALGALISEPEEIEFKGGIRFMPLGSPATLGTDLTDDHPVSFSYNMNLAMKKGELALPSALPKEIRLDKNKQMQCTSCHDPHDNTFGRFLVMSNLNSKLCTTCHLKEGWKASSHAISDAPLDRKSNTRWTNTDYHTVRQNGCENCHRPHTGIGRERLLIHKFEEDNCIVCHNGETAGTDIETELTKPFGHFVQQYLGVHDAAETFALGDVPKHVECSDCHNPHQANNNRKTDSSGVAGTNRGVKGINTGGQDIKNSGAIYEICFKCHGDNNILSRLPITREVNQKNTRLEFNTANPSFHPILGKGMNSDVPSLLPPYTTESIISCIDCHNSDNAENIRGPHGSVFDYILSKNYETSDNTVETSQSYALCYKCHSRSSILNDESFKKNINGKGGHSGHLAQGAPCSSCHDPHGISRIQGNSLNNSHLINFDHAIVQEQREFQDRGRYQGKCNLTCHGRLHSGNPGENNSYP